MDRLRVVRGADTRERDLANILGFEHSRAVRWKEGQMYVDRAEYLVRLADALDVDTMLLVQLASGLITVEQAQRFVHRVERPVPDDGKKHRRSGAAPGFRGADGDFVADATEFSTDPVQLQSANRGIVLLASTNGISRAVLADSLGRRPDVGGLVATSLSMGLTLADRYRPELIFLDLGLANVHAFDAIRVMSSLSSQSARRCRVIVGTSHVTDEIEKPALMAGAGGVALFPFAVTLFEAELDRLEERMGPRKALRKYPPRSSLRDVR